MNIQCPFPGCRVEQVTSDTPAHLQIAARGLDRGGSCPDCGKMSRAVHSRYRRRPADLPSLGRMVRVSLRVRRFYCLNSSCARQTFAERVSQLVEPFARRTRRLAEAQGRTGAALGGEAGARLLSRLSMPASADTVLRLLSRLPLPQQTEPRVVGVDDWAKCRGRSYGTIVVDLERRCVADLLPDRTAATLADWLRQRPGIEVVARDRSTEYASGITAGAPAAVQVADRWHLLANVRQAIERWLAGAHGRLRRLPAMPGEAGVVPAKRTGPFPRSISDVQVGSDSRTRRLALYDEVQRRHASGEPLIALARSMNLARGTVRAYAHASSFPERGAHRPRRSIIDRHLPHLQARVAEGCEDGAVLWRELQAHGFTGSARLVRRWLSEQRRKPARTAPHRWRGRVSATLGSPDDSTPTPLPAARQLAWLLVQPPATLSAADAATVARVEQDKDAAAMAMLARRFTALVRECNAGNGADATAASAELDAWLVDAGNCGVQTMETFAAGLKQDDAAIRAALTTPWSNGQTEGQVNRLKTIKRQMYGHASFDLLRRRVLLAA
jgi:transposase